MFENHFQKISKISRNTSDIFEKYCGKFREIFSTKILDYILETFENCFGISWKNLRKFWFAWNGCILSIARYTLFVTVCEQWQNYFFAKKIKFRKMWRKWVYTLFVIDPSFRECCRNVKYYDKSSLILSKNRLLRRTHFAKKYFVKKYFVKYSQIGRIILYTLCAVRTDFISSFLFRHCLQIVSSGLMSLWV